MFVFPRGLSALSLECQWLSHPRCIFPRPSTSSPYSRDVGICHAPSPSRFLASAFHATGACSCPPHQQWNQQSHHETHHQTHHRPLAAPHAALTQMAGERSPMHQCRLSQHAERGLPAEAFESFHPADVRASLCFCIAVQCMMHAGGMHLHFGRLAGNGDGAALNRSMHGIASFT